MKVFQSVLITALVLASSTQVAYAAKKSKGAAEPPPAPVADTAAPNSEAGEQVDVSKITEKYWAQGKETELGVVQNRKFTSANRLELELSTGTLSTDPFLSVRTYGLALGYHLNQYVSVHGMYWRNVASRSGALETFEREVPGSTVNTNMPQQFFGTQVNYNLLYGKASLLGNLIIYVDVFLFGGMGVMNTETGNNFTPFIGIGQKIHLNKFMALTIDYRLMHWNEDIRKKTRGSDVLGAYINQRSNTSDAVTLGLSFFY